MKKKSPPPPIPPKKITFFLCNFSVRTLWYFQFFFALENIKKCPQKLLIIGPKLFFSQVQPGCPDQPRIDFSYHKMSGTSICSLICEFYPSKCLPNRIRFVFIKSKKLRMKTWSFFQIHDMCCKYGEFSEYWNRSRVHEMQMVFANIIFKTFITNL